MRLLRSTILIPLVLAACEQAPTPTDPQLRPEFNTVDYATLEVTKTATAYKRSDIVYDWTLVKVVTPASVELNKGSTVTLNYKLDAVRVPNTTVTSQGVAGQICVKNTGLGPTNGLQIYDELAKLKAGRTGASSFDWEVVIRVDVDVSGKPVLAAGETHCYNYDIPIVLEPNVQYRNEAGPSIMNWDGTSFNDRDYRVEGYAFFMAATSTTVNEVDEAAQLADILTCPTGFTCTPATGSWSLTGSQTINYAVQVTNVSAPCKHTDVIENVATLTEGDSGTPRTGSADVVVTTPACEPPPPPPPGEGLNGCTPGYWKQKQHFGSWVGYTPTGTTASKYNTVFGVNLFGSNFTLLQALGQGGGGLARFGRHSTAALLSASNGGVDYGMTAAQVISAVQAAVATGNLSTIDKLASEFERRNERQCPLGRSE